MVRSMLGVLAGVVAVAGCQSAGETVISPLTPAHSAVTSSDIVIDQVYIDAPGAENREFVELHNPTPSTIDLSGWVLSDDNRMTARVFPPGTLLAPSRFLTVVKNRGAFQPWAMQVADFEWPGLDLSQTSDEVFLLRNAGAQQSVDIVIWGTPPPIVHPEGVYSGTFLVVAPENQSNIRKTAGDHGLETTPTDEPLGDTFTGSGDSSSPVFRSVPPAGNLTSGGPWTMYAGVDTTTMDFTFTATRSILTETFYLGIPTTWVTPNATNTMVVSGGGISLPVFFPGTGNLSGFTFIVISITNMTVSDSFVLTYGSNADAGPGGSAAPGLNIFPSGTSLTLNESSVNVRNPYATVEKCGDGIIQGGYGETCDLGMQNGSGLGCNNSCRTQPGFCCDGDGCTSAGSLHPSNECLECVGIAMMPGSYVDRDGASCNTGDVCNPGTCNLDSCELTPLDCTGDEQIGDCHTAGCVPVMGCTATAIPNDSDVLADILGDCRAFGCNMGLQTDVPDNGDAPADVSGDCLTYACVMGVLTPAPDLGDVPLSAAGDCLDVICTTAGPMTVDDDTDTPIDLTGDCQRPFCSGGMAGFMDDDLDVPASIGPCTVGACSGGAPRQDPRDCSGSDIPGDCQAPTCDPMSSGCQATGVPDGSDSPNSGLFCTVDYCSAGVPATMTRDCSFLDGDCAMGTCVEANSACEASPRNEGAGCDDGLGCTVGEMCNNGQCQNPTSNTCGAADALDTSWTDIPTAGEPLLVTLQVVDGQGNATAGAVDFCISAWDIFDNFPQVDPGSVDNVQSTQPYRVCGRTWGGTGSATVLITHTVADDLLVLVRSTGLPTSGDPDYARGMTFSAAAPERLRLSPGQNFVPACSEVRVRVEVVDAFGNPTGEDTPPLDVTLLTSGGPEITWTTLNAMSTVPANSVTGELLEGFGLFWVFGNDETAFIGWSSNDLPVTSGGAGAIDFRGAGLSPDFTTFSSDRASVEAGAASATITVEPYDSCQAWLGPGQTVEVFSSFGAVETVTDVGDGTYTTQLSFAFGECPVTAQLRGTVGGFELPTPLAVDSVCSLPASQPTRGCGAATGTPLAILALLALARRRRSKVR